VPSTACHETDARQRGGIVTARRATVGGHTYEFPTLVELMAKATPARSGDVLAGCAAESAAERVAAQTLLADLPLATFLDEQVVGYEEDDVTRLILDTHDPAAFAPVASLTVGGFRDRLLAWPPPATRRRSAAWPPG
jgi:ethanolamine ammonia-lyase large subunit